MAIAAFACTLASGARAEPVRVAVVGFTGDLSSPELTDLAVNIRGSLSRQADPKTLIVVTRDEMGQVYRERGGPCRPDDVPCIVEASDMWQGRLFLRGVLVATSQTPPSTKWDMGVAVSILVRELLDGEKAFRTRMNAGVTAAAAAAGDAGPVQCKCLAIQNTAVAGQLVADDTGLRFEAAPASAVKYQWRYGWAKVAKVEPAQHGVNPAIHLVSATNDDVTVYFNLGDDRDKCLASLGKKRAAHR